MIDRSNVRTLMANWRAPFRRVAASLSLALLVTGAACASDGGGSVYPLGAETILPGRMPGAGQTMFVEFTYSYSANELVGSHGQALLPGFHLGVGAVAGKILHNWGVHVLGGALVTSAALPLVDIRLSTPMGKQSKIGIGNADIETAIAYTKGPVRWWYGVEVYPPGFSYKKDALVNIGQHNTAVAPAAAFTYLPDHGRIELSSKFQYIVNGTNGAMNYRSGNEFVWEYAGMRNITRAVAIGGNGFYYQQTTDDVENGLAYLSGNRGRNLAFGPEVRCHFKHFSMILKWHKDFLTENRAAGNAFWLQFGVPLGGHHSE
jgi:hypothetical protein